METWRLLVAANDNTRGSKRTAYKVNQQEAMMRNVDLLMLLAQKLKEIPNEGFSMADLTKDALSVAGHMPEFQKRGFAVVSNDNGPFTEMHPRGSSRVVYQGLYDLDAAARFFDITYHESAHLFAKYEQDVYGNTQPSPFDPKGGPDRTEESAAWVGGRIKVFVHNKQAAHEEKKAS